MDPASDAPAQPGWRVIGASVRGDAHRRKGLPNQDAMLSTSDDLVGSLVVAVSDGHGSPKAFRSDIGSRLAVSIAARIVREFVQRIEPSLTSKEILLEAGETLPTQIADRWREEVLEDLKSNPFSDGEFAAGDPATRDEVAREVGVQPELAYGATLLVSAVVEQHLLFMQLGDGDILTVSPSGEIRRPMPADARLIANETTSLCGASAAADFRIVVQDLRAIPAELVLVATDGYGNSFVDDAAFLKVGTDILARLRSDGVAPVGEELQGWLVRASQEGSGDDITLGLLLRSDAAPDQPTSDRAAPSDAPVAADTGPVVIDASSLSSASSSASFGDRRVRGGWVLIGAVLLAGIVGVAIGALAFGGEPTSEPLQPSAAWVWGASGLVRLAPGPPTTFPLAQFDGKHVIGVAAGEGSVWVATDGGSVFEFDERSPEAPVGDPISLPSRLSEISFSQGAIWAMSESGADVFRIDPRSRDVTVVRIGSSPSPSKSPSPTSTTSEPPATTTTPKPTTITTATSG